MEEWSCPKCNASTQYSAECEACGLTRRGWIVPANLEYDWPVGDKHFATWSARSGMTVVFTNINEPCSSCDWPGFPDEHGNYDEGGVECNRQSGLNFAILP